MGTIRKRTTSNGGVRYRAEVRLKGFRPESATFSRLTDAKRWIQRTEASTREGRHLPNTQAKRITFAGLVDRYLAEELSRPERASLRRKQEPQLRWWSEQLGHLRLSDIGPSQIREALHRLETETVPRLVSEMNPDGTRGPSTVNRYLAALSRMYTVAVEHWELCDRSPVRRGMKREEPPPLTSSLTPDQVSRILEECKASGNPYLYSIALIALGTGARKMEILTLEWKHVDLKRGTLHFPKTKTGNPRTVPISRPVVAELERLAKVRRIDTQLVFPGYSRKTSDKPVSIDSAWRKAVERAGFHIRFHDLRHACAASLKASGASNAQIAAVLGHRTLQMVARYGETPDSAVFEAVNRANEQLFQMAVNSSQ